MIDYRSKQGFHPGTSQSIRFDDANPRLTASQASVRCGMTRTATRRYQPTRQHLSYVARDGKLFG